MKFYQHWIGDYQGATKTLSMLEHGAYRLLMDEYYSTERPLPANAMQLHRVCMAFASEEQEAVHAVLKRYFTLTDEGWVHNRIESEIKKALQVSEKRRLAAELRWERENKKDANADANAYAKGMQKGCYPQPQAIDIHTSEKSPPDKRKFDSIPYVDVVEAYHKFCPSLPKVSKISDKRRKAIKAGWKRYEKNPGGFPAVLDTLFKKAESSDFLTGRSGGWGGACFDWLLNEANMLKVIEGNYDNKKAGQTGDWRDAY